MGQSCGCADSSQEDKIKELEKLLAEQKDDIRQLEDNYINITKQAKALQKNNSNDSTKLEKQMKALESEKKNTIKELMKEKKKNQKLQETKQKLENKKRNMEKQIVEYKRQITKIESSSSSATKSTNYGHGSGYTDEYSEVKSPSMSVSPSPNPQSYQYDLSDFDVNNDMTEIYEWLVTKSGDKKQDHKFFNKKMTDLLCRRPKQHLLLIREKWSSKYGKTLADQIEHKLSGKTRGIPYRILSGLLQSEAEIDCRWIQECLYNNMQIDPIANVLCCRNVNEMIGIKMFWKEEYDSRIIVMLDKCANQYKKNTMLHLFRNLCNTEQRERNIKMQTKEKVNLIEIDKHIEWMIGMGKFNHDKKEKMCKLITINSNDYIDILVNKFKNKSKNNESIIGYLDKKYGAKSTVGMHLKNHLLYVENKTLFFANNIKHLCETKEKFKENNLEILHIFLSRFQVDLNQIQIQFADANNGTSLRHYIKEKGANHPSLYFLMKIMENAKRWS